MKFGIADYGMNVWDGGCFDIEERLIGFNFDGGRLNDMSGVGIALPFQEKKWEEGPYEFSTDEWGNTWHRIKGLSQGATSALLHTGCDLKFLGRM